MQSIRVEASGPYDVIIGSGSLGSLGGRTASLVSGRRALIVSDDIVMPLYGNIARDSLESAGFEVSDYVFANGEGSKNLHTYAGILDAAARAGLTRYDVMIALGGGVVGDLTGFAAATYMRGISYIQVPTTLLAAVDSSVGGKTGLDLEAGKNLAGAFYQPGLVLCDPDTLASLPTEVFIDGSAEVLKYAVLEKPVLIGILSEALKEHQKNAIDNSSHFTKSYQQVVNKSVENAENIDGDVISNLELIIAYSVGIKASFVREDEHDMGKRMFLNLGHTFGHAIEKCSGYTVTHGRAVAIGMVMAAEVSAKLGVCSEGCVEGIRRMVSEAGFATHTDIPYEELKAAVFSDKKREGEVIHMILPVRIGECVERGIRWTEL